jgi:hypothetical protein
MSPAENERQLLFRLLGLQNDLVDRDIFEERTWQAFWLTGIH